MANREGTNGSRDPPNQAFCEKVGTEAKKLVFKNQTGMSRWVQMESGATAKTVIIPPGESYMCMCSPWVRVMHADTVKPLTLKTYDEDHFQFNLTTTKIIGAHKETYLMTNTNGAIPSDVKPRTRLNYNMEWWSGLPGESHKTKRNTCSWNH